MRRTNRRVVSIGCALSGYLISVSPHPFALWRTRASLASSAVSPSAGTAPARARTVARPQPFSPARRSFSSQAFSSYFLSASVPQSNLISFHWRIARKTLFTRPLEPLNWILPNFVSISVSRTLECAQMQ